MSGKTIIILSKSICSVEQWVSMFSLFSEIRMLSDRDFNVKTSSGILGVIIDPNIIADYEPEERAFLESKMSSICCVAVFSAQTHLFDELVVYLSRESGMFLDNNMGLIADVKEISDRIRNGVGWLNEKR